MRLVLGIDTGGTYTDAVLLEQASKTIFAKAKALTTHQQLEKGIFEALALVLDKSTIDPAEIALVSVSTTLATNAIVEGVNKKICAVLIGLKEKNAVRAPLEQALKGDSLIHLKGGHNSLGSPLELLDLAPLEAYLEKAPGVAGFAVAGYFSVRNPDHELQVKALLEKRTTLPVSCGHELATELDASKRALTTVLNARLIGLITSFIAAVESSLEQHRIKAPLMIVKGDGSLISAAEATIRPIETIYSGPAASLVGASFLHSVKDAIIADIGGTTTDIAVLRGGQPQLNPKGVTVGDWNTMVKAVDMHTFGLGGDSEVRLEFERLEPKLFLGPRRVIPLSLFVLEHPEVFKKTIERQIHTPLPGKYDGRFVIPLDSKGQDLNVREQALLAKLDSARALDELIEGQREFYTLQQLVSRKILAIAALTPSDAAHVLGLYQQWDAVAALKGLELFARKRNVQGKVIAMDAKELAEQIVDALRQRSADLLLDTALATEGFPEVSSKHPLVVAGLEKHQQLLKVELGFNIPIIGLGASAGTYYPEVGQRLGTIALISDHAGVANAIGAVVGLVRTEVVMLVSALIEPLFRVHHPEGSRDFSVLEEALAFAEAEARTLARAEAQKPGAREVEVQLSQEIKCPKIEDKPFFVEARFTAQAFGRPGYKEAENRRAGSSRA